jgi:hypothetical protein
MGEYLRKVLVQAEADTTDWERYIGPLQFSHNTGVHKATMISPFYTMFGYDPKAPMWTDQRGLDFEQEVEGDPTMHLRKTQQLLRSMAYHNNQHYRQKYLDQQMGLPQPKVGYQEGQLVWVRVHAPSVPNRKLAPRWEEGRVIKHVHENTYKVWRAHWRRKTITVNVTDLKPRTQGEEPPAEDAESEEEQEQAQEDAESEEEQSDQD